MALLVISVMPMVLAVDVGTDITPDIETEDFPPLIWLCDDRVVVDDRVESGRIDGQAVYDKDNNLKGYELIERHHNYAFEGEKLEYTVLVMDKNGINKIEDVYMTLGDEQGEGNDIEVNCVERLDLGDGVDESCNARIDEEEIDDWNSQVMRYYECTFTVETADSMYGEFWITAEVTDLDGLSSTVDENEFWFLNPVIALSLIGDLTFSDVRPGTVSYSDTLLVGNDADEGSAVALDMFITGTDFYDSGSSGAMCPTTNQLQLQGEGPDGTLGTDDDTGFRYYTVKGAYSTAGDDTVDDGDLPNARVLDAESYLNIQYANAFSTNLYDEAEILQDIAIGPYWIANILAPGEEFAITFKLTLPEPCNGDFDSGSLYFWGEAI